MEFKSLKCSPERKSAQNEKDQMKWDVLMDTGQRSPPVQGLLYSFAVTDYSRRETLSEVKR